MHLPQDIIGIVFRAAALLSLIGIAVTLRRILLIKLELAFLPALSLVTLCLLAGTIFWDSEQVTITMVACGVLILTWWIIFFPRQTLIDVRTPGILVYLVFLVCFAYLGKNAQFLAWDEFSHWGMVSKYISATSHLPITHGDVNFLDYPATIGIFHYFVNFGSAFSESGAIFAQGAFIAAGLLPMFNGARWRSVLTLIAVATIALFAGFWFSELGYWNNVLIDGLLSVCAAGSFTIYRFNGANARAIVAAAPVIALLPVLKDIGLLFSICIVGLIILDQAVQAITSGKIGKKECFALVGLVLFVLAVRGLWQFHLGRNGISSNFELSSESLIDRLNRPEFPAHLAAVRTAFSEAFLHMPLGPAQIPTWGWLVLLIAVSAFTPSNSARHWRALAAASSLGWPMMFAAYSATLFILYVFVFSLYEGAGVASYARYMGSFLEVWLLSATAALILQSPKERSVARTVAMTGMVLMSAWSFLATRQSLDFGGLLANPNAYVAADRNAVRSRLAGDGFEPPPGASVYSIWSGTTGLRHFITLYELSPRHANFWYYALGPKRFAGDVWSEPWTLEEFLENYRAGGFDFLFIGNADEDFWTTYGKAFEVDLPHDNDVAWYAWNSADSVFKAVRP